MHSSYELDREKQLKILKKQQQELDIKQSTNVRSLFHAKTNLDETIVRNIYPALVVIETSESRVGMGFFQYEGWLVSNAHVIKHRSEIEAGIVLRKYDRSEALLETEQAYHRPWENIQSPDIVVIKTCSDHKTVPSNSLSLDTTYSESHYFYIDAQFAIHYLDPVSPLDELPMRFRCQDGSSPQPGCSGTPIFSAQMIIGKTPTWRFEVLGALYARCNDTSAIDYSLEQTQKLVCAVPIVDDLEQIRQILISLDSADYHVKKVKYSTIIEDVHQAEASQNLSEREARLAAARITEFEMGSSPLEIELPEGLEQLDGSGFYKLEQSHLKLSTLEIEQTFFAFIGHIESLQNICINVDKEATLLSQGHWRLDCRPGTHGNYRLLQVQDNTGKRNRIHGKSASSIFAEVKIPVQLNVINGEPLAEDLRISRDNVEKGERHPSVEVDVSCIKIRKYMLTERRIGSPTLFDALPLSNHRGYDTIQAAVQAIEIERINTTNATGNTPLMLLLKKPLTDPGQRNKAKLLVQYSIWNQPNNESKTARQILEEHPDVITLKNVLLGTS